MSKNPKMDKETEALKKALKHIESLEQRNESITSMLRQQIKFSVNVAEIIFKMDNLLEKKQKRIDELEAKFSILEEFSAQKDDIEDGFIEELISTDPIEHTSSIEEIEIEFLNEKIAEDTESTDGMDEVTGAVDENIEEIVIDSNNETKETSISINEIDIDTLEYTSTGFNCPLTDCSYSTNGTGNDRYRIKRHFLVHQSEKPFKCPDCSYRCKYAESVTRHLKRKSCKGAWTQYPTGSKKGSAKRKRNSIGTFKCPDCNYECKYESSVRRHLKNNSCKGAWTQYPLGYKGGSVKRKRNSIDTATTASQAIAASETDTQGITRSKKRRKTLG